MGIEFYLQALNMYRGYTIVYKCTDKGIGYEYIGIYGITCINSIGMQGLYLF